MHNKEKAWRCLVCGYLHYENTPPQKCPICHAKDVDFSEITVPEKPKRTDVGHLHIVIIGSGIAGISAAETARMHAPEAEITIISKESERPYHRVNLTRLLAGEIKEDTLPLHSEEWFDEKNIRFIAGVGVEHILLTEKNVMLESGEQIHFDKLVVATGAVPWKPSMPGMDLERIHTIRTIENVRIILQAVEPGARVACIGGGILGLETASALNKREARVTVLEAFDHLMPNQLNAQGSSVIQRHLEAQGITVLTSAFIDRIAGDTQACAVQLKRGSSIPIDAVIVCAGDRANTSILQDAGLAVNRGALVDNFLRTSHPDIFAVGDVAEHDGMMYGAWSAALYQGRIAGMNAAGLPTEFGGISRSHLLKVVGKPMLSIGIITPKDGSYKLMEDFPDKGYRMFMFRDGYMVGALLIGKLKLLKAVRRAIQIRLDMRRLMASQPTVEEVAEWLEFNRSDCG